MFTLFSGCEIDKGSNTGNANGRNSKDEIEVRDAIDQNDSYLGIRVEFEDNATLAKILAQAVEIN